MQALKVGRKSALHRAGQHGTCRLRNVVETHAQGYFVRHIPLADESEVSWPCGAFKETDEKAETINLVNVNILINLKCYVVRGGLHGGDIPAWNC